MSFITWAPDRKEVMYTLRLGKAGPFVAAKNHRAICRLLRDALLFEEIKEAEQEREKAVDPAKWNIIVVAINEDGLPYFNRATKTEYYWKGMVRELKKQLTEKDEQIKQLHDCNDKLAIEFSAADQELKLRYATTLQLLDELTSRYNFKCD